jgi:DNA primase
LPQDPEFRRAIEDIKSRALIEDVVREHVEVFVQKGRLLWACCPMHQESTPSFKIDPSSGLWYCFGACSEGGDVIKFVERKYGMSFRDAIEMLAARAGVELPKRKGDRSGAQDDAGLAVLARAETLYRASLESREGRGAREYLESRGVSTNTIEAFGIGYAPSSGQALVQLARPKAEGGEGLSGKLLVQAGLVRVRESDRRPYDFFRGRLMIPIRDDRGRTVGFGARRLIDDEVDGRPAGPKYVNTAETPWFHKGRLIYAYDRVVEDVRRNGHLVLVEGYTDVMAAHQAGLRNVGAVLGTSTTENHASLVRRSATKKVSLVFDGDEAGRKAAWKALGGLLHLDIEIHVVTLPKGQDPADLLAGGDPTPFQAQLEMALTWFDFITEPLKGLRGRDLSREVNLVLALLANLESPVHRESMVAELAARLGMPVDALREQYRSLPAHQRGERRSAGPAARAKGGGADARLEDQANANAPDESSDENGSGSEASRGLQPARDPSLDIPPVLRLRLENAFEGVLAVALTDSGVLPRLRGVAGACPQGDLEAILETLFEMWDDESEMDVSSILTRLGDHPARQRVPSLVEYAKAAEDLSILFEDQLSSIALAVQQVEYDRLMSHVARLENAASQGDIEAAERLPEALHQLHVWMRNRNPNTGPTSNEGPETPLPTAGTVATPAAV